MGDTRGLIMTHRDERPRPPPPPQHTHTAQRGDWTQCIQCTHPAPHRRTASAPPLTLTALTAPTPLFYSDPRHRQAHEARGIALAQTRSGGGDRPAQALPADDDQPKRFLPYSLHPYKLHTPLVVTSLSSWLRERAV